MLWIYTGGHLDQKSIDRALPMMQKDVDSTMLMMGNKVEVYWKETNKALGPYAAQVGKRNCGRYFSVTRFVTELAVFVEVNAVKKSLFLFMFSSYSFTIVG